jgi:hypothetical protein
MRRTKMRNTRTLPTATYRDRYGRRHEVIVEPVESCWEIADLCGEERQVIDTLADQEDTRECAEAVARDWAGQALEPNLPLIAIA